MPEGEVDDLFHVWRTISSFRLGACLLLAAVLCKNDCCDLRFGGFKCSNTKAVFNTGFCVEYVDVNRELVGEVHRYKGESGGMDKGWL